MAPGFERVAGAVQRNVAERDEVGAAFVCALVAHIRFRVFSNIAGPILFLMLSAATLALTLNHRQSFAIAGRRPGTALG